MPLPAHTASGSGPVVVLLHGVGLGPATFAELARRLEHEHRVLVVERPGRPGAAVPLDEQADQVADLLIAEGATGGRVVGVSGGATLGVVLGGRRPEVVGSLVLHEPLVGHHAPALHARFGEAAELAATGDDGALAVVRTVMGEATWRALDDRSRQAVRDGRALARAEVAVFAAFDPTDADLARLAHLPVLTTVGGRSRPDRWAAAGVLRRQAGSEVRQVPDAGNAVQLDAPTAFADLVASWRPTPVASPT